MKFRNNKLALAVAAAMLGATAQTRGIVSVHADADPIKLLNDLKEGVEAFKQARVQAEAALKTAVEANGSDVKKALEAAEKAAKEVKALADKLVETEQKLVGAVIQNKTPPKSLGALVVESNAYKQFAEGHSSRMRVEANTIVGGSGSPTENNDTIVPAQRLPGIVPGAFRTLRIRDVIPSGTTSSNSVEYTRESSFTNDAAETAERERKPESDLEFELVNSPVRTVAHWIKASKQVLEDAPMLQSYIDNRMRYGVELRIDSQLIAGNGTAPNLSGITDSGNYTAFSPVTGDTALDSLNRAKYLIEAADYAATAIVMHPADWGEIERLKGSDNHYIIGNPQSAIGPVLWGLPVVVSNSMVENKLLVGAFNISHQVFNRAGVVVEMFAQDEDNVQKNLLTIRAEARLALATFRPASVRYGNLTV